jgi:hypothetical protein
MGPHRTQHGSVPACDARVIENELVAYGIRDVTRIVSTKIFFVKIQNSIHIILTKHQQLKIYKIFNQKKKYKVTIFNTLQCIFKRK